MLALRLVVKDVLKTPFRKNFEQRDSSFIQNKCIHNTSHQACTTGMWDQGSKGWDQGTELWDLGSPPGDQGPQAMRLGSSIV